MKTLNIIWVIFILTLCFSSCESIKYDSQSDTGEGGSTSRFTIVNNHMYAVDNKNLKVFDITEPANPVMVEKMEIGFAIETIYSLNDLLFIGSPGAMYIYDIKVPDSPVKLSETSHVYSCDPVVADDHYAYVTLRSNSGCRWGWNNELQVIDITDPTNTQLVETYPLDNPYGLAVEGDRLYVCANGEVIVYDKSDAPDLSPVYTINVDANDIIVLDSILLLITDRAMYEYSYTDNNATYISRVYAIEN